MKKERRKSYVGILDGSKNVWGVRLPDIDGCVGGGSTPEAAIADVTQALRDVLGHLQVKGIAFPKASSTTKIINREKPDKTESTVIITGTLDRAEASAPISQHTWDSRTTKSELL